jgi:hypothetical protein
MTFVINDRVKETTTTTGTGTLTLDGAATGFETFSGALGNTNTTYYAIVSQNSGDFEVGIGTVGAGTLSRDTVISSSNSDALVIFGVGTKDVFVTLPASKTILLNDSDTVDLTGNLDLNSNDITGTGNINITGNLTASGNLTSLGIDDNATSTAITINSSEQVGIGTASPSEILHIEGNSPYLVISNTGENVGGIKMYDSADSGGQYFHLTYDSASSNEVSFDTGASGEYTFNVNTAEKMRIDSSGNLGIGTASPSSKLDIYNGGINVDTTGGTLTATRYNSGSGSSLILLQKSQSATIGTQSALSNGYGIGGIITKGSDGTSFINTTAISSEVDGTVSTNSVPSRITFSTNSGSTSYSERMRITSSGNVGIGTTAPDALLSVNGVASFGDGTALLPSIANFGDLNTGMWFPAADTIAFSEGGAEAMRITSDGRVGIGTSSPTEKLSVDGSVIFINSSKSSPLNICTILMIMMTASESNRSLSLLLNDIGRWYTDRVLI